MDTPQAWQCARHLLQLARAERDDGMQGAGIAVVQASNVTLANNVLLPAQDHAFGLAALYVDVITPDTQIRNNTFVNLTRDAWMLPIATGAALPVVLAQLAGQQCTSRHGISEAEAAACSPFSREPGSRSPCTVSGFLRACTWHGAPLRACTFIHLRRRA